MTTLHVIAGPPQSGKIAAMWSVASRHPNALCIHRDQLRVSFGRAIDENALTTMMAAMAKTALGFGYDVVVCAQNETDGDRETWLSVAANSRAKVNWLHTSQPGVVPPVA